MPIFDLVLIAILVVVIVVTVVVIHAVILENAKAILDNGNNKADINDVAFEIIVSFGVGIVIMSCFFGFIFLYNFHVITLFYLYSYYYFRYFQTYCVVLVVVVVDAVDDIIYY